jgi:hypothetical protein
MSNDTTTEPTAIDHLIAGFNAIHRQQDATDTNAVCDFCSGPIEPGDRVATYLSDTDLGGYARPLPGTTVFAHRTYCSTCDRQHIIYPHEGTTELLFGATYRADGTHTKWIHRDSSPATHGEPWDGEAAYSFLFGDFFRQLSLNMALEQFTIGHEDIADHIRLAGVDLREIFDENGTIVASPTKRERLHQRVYEQLVDLVGHGDEPLSEHFDREGRPGAFTCPECGAQADYWADLAHRDSCSSAQSTTPD